MVLPDLSAHAEAQGDHVMLLAVPRAAAFDVVQQGCLQSTSLCRRRNTKVSTTDCKAGRTD